MELTMRERPRVAPRRAALAVLAAVGIQLGALASLWGAIAIVIVNTLSFGEPKDPSGWIYVAPLLALGSVVSWIASGFVATRITGRRSYWATLAISPAVFCGAVLLLSL